MDHNGQVRFHHLEELTQDQIAQMNLVLEVLTYPEEEIKVMSQYPKRDVMKEIVLEREKTDAKVSPTCVTFPDVYGLGKTLVQSALNDAAQLGFPRSILAKRPRCCARMTFFRP